MKSMKFLLACTVLCAAPAFADEGMWTFDNFPAAKVKAKYGVDITPAWLDHVRSNAVRLSTGCSASIVSSSGLVLTNNHCVARMRPGPLVPGPRLLHPRLYGADPGQRAQVLRDAGGDPDVDQRCTPQVTAAGKGLTGDALVKARTADAGTIEKAGCPDTAHTRCQVVNLYHGGQYKLYPTANIPTSG